jgi:hypothetical protein
MGVHGRWCTKSGFDLVYGQIAQLVEHWIENPGVVGSIPTLTTFGRQANVGSSRLIANQLMFSMTSEGSIPSPSAYGDVAEWSIALAWKAGGPNKVRGFESRRLLLLLARWVQANWHSHLT